MDYLEDTRQSAGTRSLGCFLCKIHLEYGAAREVDGMEKLQEMLVFKRRPDRGIRVFWKKCRRSKLYAEKPE